MSNEMMEECQSQKFTSLHTFRWKWWWCRGSSGGAVGRGILVQEVEVLVGLAGPAACGAVAIARHTPAGKGGSAASVGGRRAIFG